MRLLSSLAVAVSATLLSAVPAAAQTSDKPPVNAEVARGQYLAKAADCGACHREVHTGGPAYAGGYVIASPMGNIVAPNITPSKTAGIGNWSFADFEHVMRKGERPDGEKLYPAMPYTDYQGINDADMHALYAYFMQGVQPVDTVAPKTHLPFPFGIRAIMGPWNWLFRSNKPFTATIGLSPQAQRGQYLVETLGHCGSCHTPAQPADGGRERQGTLRWRRRRLARPQHHLRSDQRRRWLERGADHRLFAQRPRPRPRRRRRRDGGSGRSFAALPDRARSPGDRRLSQGVQADPRSQTEAKPAYRLDRLSPGSPVGLRDRRSA